MKFVRPSLLVLCGSLAFAGSAIAEEPVHRNGNASSSDSSPFDSDKGKTRMLSDIWVPVVSFVLPGFGQYFEGQTEAGLAYSGVAVAGYAYAINISTANNLAEKQKKDKEEREKNGEKEPESGFNQKDPALRKSALGEQVAQWSGGMSAYHAFRTAVRSRKDHGEYEFLGHEETLFELMSAPFHFGYLTRPTTFIPLSIGVAIAALQMRSAVPDNVVRDTFTSSDAFFAGAFSYNAGTHEEAMFRGWIMPVMRDSWGSDFWSNAAQSVIFAAAHLNQVQVPLAQLLLGYHLGYVTQKNGWMLGENIFIHAWWDVLAFGTLYHYKQTEPDAKKASSIVPVLWLPPLQYNF